MKMDVCFFFFKQKTAYEIKECDWSSDVCSSDLFATPVASSAHACLPPVVTARALVSAVTAAGFGDDTFLELPIWPCTPVPQQAAAPNPLRPQVNWLPAATPLARKVPFRPTPESIPACPVMPSPCWPYVLSPQQRIVP